ncbi:MAG TPA: biotin transporter BioY [Jatrophihabitantaceae bacterium]|jgi:biotin transport system substrate-specific component
MTSSALQRPVLVDLVPGALARDTGAIGAGAALTGLSAQVSIHTGITPVPFTLQTLAVVLVGAALGSVRGVLSMALYLVAGGLGVPWFAGHASGFGGPSFGYLVGFVAAAALIGAAAERRADRRIWSAVTAMLGGGLLIYGIGMLWLKRDLDVDLRTSFDLGVRPFLISDALKLGLASLALPATWRLVGRVG